jgi:hypothetical protein
VFERAEKMKSKIDIDIQIHIAPPVSLPEPSIKDQWNTALERAEEKMKNQSHVMTLTDPVSQNLLTKSQLAMATLVELQNLIEPSVDLSDLQSMVTKQLPEQMATMCGRETVHCPAICRQFRTMNGNCNNPKHPLWGAGNFCLL